MKTTKGPEKKHLRRQSSDGDGHPNQSLHQHAIEEGLLEHTHSQDAITISNNKKIQEEEKTSFDSEALLFSSASPSPGALAVSATEDSPAPNTPLPSETQPVTAVVARLVQEPPTAVGIPVDSASPSEMEEMLRKFQAENKAKRIAVFKQISFGILGLLLLGGTTVGVLLATGVLSPGTSDSQQGLARCKRQVEVLTQNCQPVAVNATLFHDGDNEAGNNITLALSHNQQFLPGTHELQLIVTDQDGNTDSCDTALVVIDTSHESDTEWTFYRGHAYRLHRGCPTSFHAAKRGSELINLCGAAGHLITITSSQEQSLAIRLVENYGQIVWIGGFQTDGAFEPNGGWEWVNLEGSLATGFTDWDTNEPNSENEDCLAMHSENRDYKWDDRRCRSKYAYLEEVELDVTVVLGECDTGVFDVVMEDPSSSSSSSTTGCTFLISNGLSNCRSEHDDFIAYETCVNRFLDDMITEKVLSFEDAAAIAACGNFAIRFSEPPVARCHQGPVEVISNNNSCEASIVNASLFNDGSTGVNITFSLLEKGPFLTGDQQITLVVSDDRGRNDTCSATMIVLENGDESGDGEWSMSAGHAYRVHRGCRTTFLGARRSAEKVNLCGSMGHLVTITASQERDLVVSLVENERQLLWLGGYQLQGAQEPTGGWVWVNDEGNIYSSFTDWDGGEPNSGAEDCLAMHGVRRDYKWDDRRCSSRHLYVEEVDLSRRVVINGCDTGIDDVVVMEGAEIETCSYLISDAVAVCEGSESVEAFQDCLNVLLIQLVTDSLISFDEASSVATCAGFSLQTAPPPVARCRSDPVFIATETCEIEGVNASLVNDGVLGDNIQLSILPSGPLSTGIHEVSLVATDRFGQTDTCNSTVVVAHEPQDELAWDLTAGGAYRFHTACRTSFDAARIVTERNRLCGQNGHLVTLTSANERDRVLGNIGTNLVSSFWVGGYKRSGSLEWSWVNNDGAIDPQVVDIEFGATDEGEECLVVEKTDQRLEWFARSCSENMFYIEEVSLNQTVVVGDCDSGVFDLLGDTATCSFLISDGLDECESQKGVVDGYDTCVNDFLSGLVAQKVLLFEEALSIAGCANVAVDFTRPPVARCKSAEIAATGCRASNINASLVDDGSTGDNLSLEITPATSLAVGKNLVTLLVTDEFGRNDTCNTELLVFEEVQGDALNWTLFGSHAYAVTQRCRADFFASKRAAENINICGKPGHLVTVTSVEERDHVVSLIRGAESSYWIGGFQEEGADDPVKGGWTWVNNEGLIELGFTDWKPGEPNRDFEKCLGMSGANQNYQWVDRRCSSRSRFLAEVDPSQAVVVEGCDSGVLDILTNATSCAFLLASGIEQCTEVTDALESKIDCIEVFLAQLVDNLVLSFDEASSIAACAGFSFTQA